MTSMSEETAERPRVYVVVEGRWKSGDASGCLLLDTGEVLWAHMSSNLSWLERDLTTSFGERRQRLADLYPDGYDVVVAQGDSDIPDEVLARNAARKPAETADGDEAAVSA